jgi:hypothetical protein
MSYALFPADLWEKLVGPLHPNSPGPPAVLCGRMLVVNGHSIINLGVRLADKM